MPFFRSAGARRLGGCAQLPFDRRQGDFRAAGGIGGAGFMACAGPEAERPALRVGR